MATSLFFAFPEACRELFARAASKGDWYEAVQASGPETAPTLNGEDTAAAWHYALSAGRVEGPVGRMYVGDMNSGASASADPEVVFHGASSVHEIALDLRARGEGFFRSVLSLHGHEAESWLFEPMAQFFEAAASGGNAVVLVWGV